MKQLNDKIKKLRSDLKVLDKGLIELITQRCDCVKKIGHYKKMCNSPIEDNKQEKKVFEYYLELAKIHHLDKDFVISLAGLLIKLSKEIQSENEKAIL